MHKFEIVKQEFSDGPYYTFTVDGFPSMKWFKECKVKGLEPTYYVDRCIGRLKAGRSTEAFGGPTSALVGDTLVSLGTKPGRAKIVQDDRPPVMETVDTKNGPKEREKRKGYRYEVDEKLSEEEYPTESSAKAAAAIYCFMTRNKLGRLQAAQDRLEAENPGCECKVWTCGEEHGICATVNGERYNIGWVLVNGIWEVEQFKKIITEVADEA